MIKKLFSMALLCLVAQMGIAQNVLEVSDVSQTNDIYSSDTDNGAVVIKCNKSIPLSFESSMDKTAQPYSTDIEGSDSVYYLEFPTGDRYRGRILTLMAPGYSSVDVPMELRPKQVVTLKVIDPNSMVDAGCYRGHRNKGVEELKNMNYEEAKAQFGVACECSDVDTAENNRNIALVDTLIEYRKQADVAFSLLDYRKAATIYNKIVNLNPYDSFALDRQKTCVTRFSSECETTFRQAEYYFNEKQYDKAKSLYQRVVRDECNQMTFASAKLNQIESYETAKKNHAHVLTYEYNKETPIGFSYGKYNMHKAGGFIAFDINSKVFELMRNNCAVPDHPELNLAFGWTLKIANPVWIYFGPGFTTKAYYGDYKVSNNEAKFYPDKDGNPPTDKRGQVYNDSAKINLTFAISPVIGICAKYSYFSFRITYQYRFAMQAQFKDFMRQQRISIGIGAAF